MKIKGVSKENHLLVSIPSEFSYATNFYLFGYIVNPPKLLVKIRGETLSEMSLPMKLKSNSKDLN